MCDPAAILSRMSAQPLCPDLGEPGELLALVPLHGLSRRETPFGTIVGGPGLDARRFTNLSTLSPDRMITPTAEVFLRTAAPQAATARQHDWIVALTASDGRTSRLSVGNLIRRARPMAAHLIECAGNNDPDNFGLMSVVDWHGVPLTEIVDELAGPDTTANTSAAVLVTGIDHDAQTSWRSIPGASWVLPRDAIRQRGAFLATGMNGAPLPLDHGGPVRLVVPGWYGCSWIKWVDAIRMVGPDEPSTSQMREFAARTHQRGVPDLARAYEPPEIDLAAAPIRVEKRRVAGRLEYRIVGIVWGGTRPAARLGIRFRAGDPPRVFPICPAPSTHHTWSLWEYRWRPPSTGVYDIVLTCPDPGVRTRRLDLSFYARRVIIDEI